jgi:hypothetical protein
VLTRTFATSMREGSYPHLRWPLAMLVAVLTLSAALVLGFALGRQTAPQGPTSARSGEPWPPFTMVYRETMLGETWVRRLRYRNRLAHCSEVIESPPTPTPSPDPSRPPGPPPNPFGDESATCERLLGQPEGIGPKDSYPAPARWLIPSRLPPIAQRAGAFFPMPGSDGLASAHLETQYAETEGGHCGPPGRRSPIG